MYAKVEVMRRKFGEHELIQLTDTEQPYTGEINYDKLNAAIEEANSEVDAYLASRYTLPLHPIPPFLINIACNLARYYAETGNLSENSPIKIRFDGCMRTLTKIAKGEIGLGGTPAGDSTPTKSSANNVVFTVGRHDFGDRSW
ncbi:gp436 family protein [Acinetobacter nectaris]|uniref:gp436 family protein n=1 Tax=Acinetobacter nectaris TaxID=1219382 RepID=UPI001F4600C4|nr:DUF1320 domain-containing protein [Acinetobacter nectaris]MCF9046628.1 DUF1320 domain-containing protein [Acinetobacter nectaris]